MACAEACAIENDRGGHQVGRIWNVSVAGVYVVTQPYAELSEPVTLSFCLPGDAAPIRVRARIAWFNPPSPVRGLGGLAPHLPPGCGLQYLDLSPRDRRRIEDRVRQASADASGPDDHR